MRPNANHRPCYLFSFCRTFHHRCLHSFPTRRSSDLSGPRSVCGRVPRPPASMTCPRTVLDSWRPWMIVRNRERSEEHTSELQSRGHLVCRLLLEKKNILKFSRLIMSPDNLTSQSTFH